MIIEGVDASIVVGDEVGKNYIEIIGMYIENKPIEIIQSAVNRFEGCLCDKEPEKLVKVNIKNAKIT